MITDLSPSKSGPTHILVFKVNSYFLHLINSSSNFNDRPMAVCNLKQHILVKVCIFLIENICLTCYSNAHVPKIFILVNGTTAIGRQTIHRQTIGRKTIDRQTIGRQTIGQQADWPKDYWPTDDWPNNKKTDKCKSINRTMTRNVFWREIGRFFRNLDFFVPDFLQFCINFCAILHFFAIFYMFYISILIIQTRQVILHILGLFDLT
jgi:hypothetical protein